MHKRPEDGGIHGDGLKGNMSIAAYKAKFPKLSRSMPNILGTEAQKANKLRGLYPRQNRPTEIENLC